jgi:hypothetical protein
MNHRIYTLALGLIPLALTVGCEKKQTKEEIIAEYEATRVEQERVAKLEEELADLQATMASEANKNPQAQQVISQQQQALQKQLQEAKQQLEEQKKIAQEAEAKPSTLVQQDEAAAPPPERERVRTLTVAKGTHIVVSLSSEIGTDTHNAGDAWSGTLAQDVSADDQMLWTAGTSVRGIIQQSTPTGRLANGEGALAIKLTTVSNTSIDGGIYVVTGDGKGARNARVIGGLSALGALVGVASSRSHQTDHALGGAAIGAAVGTAVAAGTANTTIKIPASSPITFVVPADEQVNIRSRGQRGQQPSGAQ